MDTPSFMAPKVRQKARCHSCGVKGEQLRNQAPNQTCLQRCAGVRARGGCSVWLDIVGASVEARGFLLHLY